MSYTQGIADTICDRLSLGESLRAICEDDDMPHRITVLRWLRRDDEIGESFRTQYARAREDQADSLIDECELIADDGRNDWMEKRNAEGMIIGFAVNGEHVARSKLRIEQRRWHASKLKPKKYGDKLDLTTGGETMTPNLDDAAAKVAALMAAAKARKENP